MSGCRLTIRTEKGPCADGYCTRIRGRNGEEGRRRTWTTVGEDIIGTCTTPLAEGDDEALVAYHNHAINFHEGGYESRD